MIIKLGFQSVKYTISSVSVFYRIIILLKKLMTLVFPFTARLDSPIDQLEDVVRLARYCHLDSLMEQLEDRMKKVVSFGVCFTILVFLSPIT